MLTSKFTFPPLRADLVDRPVLVERLNQGLNRRLTLISAPAGYGKTTLANVWLSRYIERVVWLSLDKTDNNPAGFFDNIISAIQSIYPPIEKYRTIFHDSPDVTSLELLATEISHELSRIDPFFILAFDNLLATGHF